MKLPTGQIYAKAMLDELGVVGVTDVRDVAAQLELKSARSRSMVSTARSSEPKAFRSERSPSGAASLRRAEKTSRSRTRSDITFCRATTSATKCASTPMSATGPTLASNWNARPTSSLRVVDPRTSYARPRFSETTPSLQTISALAADCRASLSATAWRYCDLTPYACAIVWSKESRIAWSRASAEFDFFIEWGKYLERGMFARDLFESGETEGDSPSPVELDFGSTAVV